MNLKLAYSSCPNDTFIFYALVHGLIDLGKFQIDEPYIADVEQLNQKAFQEEFAITKLSFAAWLRLQKEYYLLDAGSALGFGCGPLLISKKNNFDAENTIVAIPGEYTTANLLLNFWSDQKCQVKVMRFDEIMPAVMNGECDAGVIIHEGRFVFEKYGLKKIVDLGAWWEKTTKAPIPLGCIVASKKIFTPEEAEQISQLIHHSIEYAYAHREETYPYIKKYAQDLDDDVIDAHISLYVNDFSLSLGSQGNEAIRILKEKAIIKGLL